ncbi:Signal transduction histidine kinase [hydrothermal vent metagenome]|uniref:histidine kinase n=1 Tax=hydrothermal vent metagenome TaxID=652676 RepID=A0A3B0SG04_9ZZZZ
MKPRPSKLRRRLGLEWAGVALFASLIIVALSWWNSLSSFDNLVYDQVSDMNRPAPPTDILIVAVDEDSLSQYGKWPWSRTRHIELFDQIAEAKPRAIAFDILMSEPGDTQTDQDLAEAMARNINLYVPLHFVIPGSDGAKYDIKKPIAPIEKAVSGVGHVNLLFDADGAVRHTTLCFGKENGGKPWLHLMELVYRGVYGQQSPAFERLERCSKPLLMPYSERASFSSISFAAIANGEVPPGFLEDKIILIGATANGLGDRHPVPLGDGGTLAGVEIMANMLGAIIRDDFIVPMPFWQQILLALIPTWILLAGFWRWRPRTTLLVSLSLIAGVLLTSALLLSLRIWFAPGSALLGIALVYPIWGWRRLQATSDFMDEELQTFHESKIDIPVVSKSPGPVDVVTGQAEELTHAIAHMRDLRRFISDALTNLPDPMFVTDLQGKVKFVNKLAQTGVEDGAQDHELNDMLRRFVSPEDLSDVKEYLAMKMLPAEQDFVDFTSQKGEVFAMRRAIVQSDEGEHRGYIHYLADITELANAAQEREEVLELLSHDMRAPQAAILALLESQEPSDARNRIESHARRTLALADNFVGLARIKSSEFTGEDVLLSELVSEASDSLWPLAKTRDISCHIDDQSDGAFVLGEPSSLHRSFVNLLDNAIKYSPDGGKINVTLRRISLDNIDYVSAEIVDQGKGISAAVLGNLFERFASDDSGSKGTVKGAGLGLNFVAAVIERHGGSIRAENIKERKDRSGGACFTILLPIAPDPED